jgi:predicted nucleic acid-binding protein
MRYLFDVNALIAYGLSRHHFHNQVGAWIQSQHNAKFLTCSITELGFVRVLGNVRTYGLNVEQAKVLLLDLKSRPRLPLVFIADENDLNSLPAWVSSPQQVTDGHLVQLAQANASRLATLDKGIPGSFLIP